MRFKAVIFDLDGTLLDTIEDLADSMNSVLAAEGFPVHPVESYKYFVGTGVRNLVAKALPENYRDDATVERCVAAMRREYGLRWSNKTRPYEGIPELLDGLKESGVKMAVLSNKPDEFTRLITGKLLARWEFDVVFGERPMVPRKPNPAAALEIAAILGLNSGEILYLGDSGTDMQTARAAGMYAAGVLWGFRKADELLAAGAQSLISRPADLLDIIGGSD
jgi:phosphoglycolate phosphatase